MGVDEVPDAELLERGRAGPEVFAVLYARHADAFTQLWPTFGVTVEDGDEPHRVKVRRRTRA